MGSRGRGIGQKVANFLIFNAQNVKIFFICPKCQNILYIPKNRKIFFMGIKNIFNGPSYH